LAHSNVDVKGWGEEVVPGIRGKLTQIIAAEETHDTSIKTSFL